MKCSSFTEIFFWQGANNYIEVLASGQVAEVLRIVKSALKVFAGLWCVQVWMALVHCSCLSWKRAVYAWTRLCFLLLAILWKQLQLEWIGAIGNKANISVDIRNVFLMFANHNFFEKNDPLYWAMSQKWHTVSPLQIMTNTLITVPVLAKHGHY